MGQPTNASQSAAAKPSGENPLGLPAKALSTGGSLFICGGGRISSEVYDEFVRIAGGERAHLVVIPSAHDFPTIDAARRRYSLWSDYHLASLDFLDAKTRGQADTKTFAAALAKATGVWFSGGMQSRLSTIYAGTRAETALHEVVERGGVIGGTSAGAAIMSQTMIHSGRGERVNLDRGLGFLSAAIVDQHFSQRNRQSRLLAALDQHPEQVGLGIDEATAVVVSGNRLRVIGANHATLAIPQAIEPVIRTLKADEQVELVATTNRAAGEALVTVREVPARQASTNRQPQRDLRAAATSAPNSDVAQAPAQ